MYGDSARGKRAGDPGGSEETSYLGFSQRWERFSGFTIRKNYRNLADWDWCRAVPRSTKATPGLATEGSKA